MNIFQILRNTQGFESTWSLKLKRGLRSNKETLMLYLKMPPSIFQGQRWATIFFFHEFP